ncbi:hypothetical protein KA082_00865 [Candidatus Woesebacteria bacterium]|nr:hypothetical protein [Candidatus Woesebacteria bacterium]
MPNKTEDPRQQVEGSVFFLTDLLSFLFIDKRTRSLTYPALFLLLAVGFGLAAEAPPAQAQGTIPDITYTPTATGTPTPSPEGPTPTGTPTEIVPTATTVPYGIIRIEGIPIDQEKNSEIQSVPIELLGGVHAQGGIYTDTLRDNGEHTDLPFAERPWGWTTQGEIEESITISVTSPLLDKIEFSARPSSQEVAAGLIVAAVTNPDLSAHVLIEFVASSSLSGIRAADTSQTTMFTTIQTDTVQIADLNAGQLFEVTGIENSASLTYDALSASASVVGADVTKTQPEVKVNAGPNESVTFAVTTDRGVIFQAEISNQTNNSTITEYILTDQDQDGTVDQVKPINSIDSQENQIFLPLVVVNK